MTATAESPAPAAPVPAPAVPFPLPPEATVVGGLFPSVDGPLRVMRALRRSGAAGDIVGLAVPLPGDPDDPTTLQRLAAPRPKKGFDVIGYLKVVFDPHAPPPAYRTLVAGQNSVLTRLVLRDLASWIAGVKTFRIPPTLTGDVSKDEAQGGVWVLGRSNHAAAVAGGGEADLGGALGALAGIGVPRDLVLPFAERIAGGQVLLTTCETDAGRARRDSRWLRKNGARDVFEQVILSPRRIAPTPAGTADGAAAEAAAEEEAAPDEGVSR
jgi:hypothetical protein